MLAQVFFIAESIQYDIFLANDFVAEYIAKVQSNK
jgi:hypothetical protein